MVLPTVPLPVYSAVVKNFSYYTSFWYVGRAKTQEEFDQLSSMEESTEVLIQQKEG